MYSLIELIEEGKIKYVGLSEAPPEFIKRAHKIVPISAVQQEWSLIARDLEEKGGIVDTCRQLGIGIVPYRYAFLFMTSEKVIALMLAKMRTQSQSLFSFTNAI